MISKTIAHCANKSQDRVFCSKEGEKELKDRLFRTFVANLIREYATYTSTGCHLLVNDLPYADKKQFLIHLTHVDDYAYYIANKTREAEAIKEYEDEMQHFIDWQLDDVYHEDMQEMGMLLCRHRDNGESYYRS
jgi:hypothetical protein